LQPAALTESQRQHQEQVRQRRHAQVQLVQQGLTLNPNRCCRC
jgi:hypothetical protein